MTACSPDVIEIDKTTVVVVEYYGSPEIVEVMQGPPGPPGPPGQAGVSYLTYPAGLALGGHRIVVINAGGEAVYADKDVPSHAGKVIGMTSGAIAQGASAQIMTGGEIDEPSWSWTLDSPVFLGNDGLLTQTPPAFGFQLVVGFPITPTKMLLSFREPIILN